LLADQYDTVINFILLKDECVENNIEYLSSLHLFCNQRAKNLIHISSISVYSDESIVSENTAIETNSNLKGAYSTLKIESDIFLVKQKKNYNLTFVRPGFIVSELAVSSTAGICINLPLNLSILLGNSKSTLPLINRERMHLALDKICNSSKKLSCYLLVEKEYSTKYNYIKKRSKRKLIIPSYKATFIISKVLFQIGILNAKRLNQIKGLFRSTRYNASETERALNMSLAPESIAVVGSGVYGCYAIRTIFDKYPSANVTLYEVGSNKLKNEDEIGFTTTLTTSYSGLSKGRYFGLGGTSRKWGGQLLFFTKNDFQNPNPFILDLISLTEKYKDEVLRKFKIFQNQPELKIYNGQTVKIGLWLGYFNRNLFKFFKLNKEQNLTICDNTRILKLISHEKKIVGLEIQRNQNLNQVFFDHIILTAGAFESNRILLESGLIQQEKIYFSDHLSRKVFKVYGERNLENIDFNFDFIGTSLVTRRLIGEVDGYSYFANPVYNSSFPFFQELKKTLFKGELNILQLKKVILDLPQVIKFIYVLLIKRKLAVYNDEWEIHIDIENPKSNSYIKLGSKERLYNAHSLDVFFDMDREMIKKIYHTSISEIKALLIRNNLKFEIISEDYSYEKLEDTYHPFNMELSDSINLESFYNKFPSILVVNTGILPRAGGINVTASLFPIIDDFVQNKLILQNEI